MTHYPLLQKLRMLVLRTIKELLGIESSPFEEESEEEEAGQDTENTHKNEQEDTEGAEAEEEAEEGEEEEDGEEPEQEGEEKEGSKKQNKPKKVQEIVLNDDQKLVLSYGLQDVQKLKELADMIPGVDFMYIDSY